MDQVPLNPWLCLYCHSTSQCSSAFSPENADIAHGSIFLLGHLSDWIILRQHCFTVYDCAISKHQEVASIRIDWHRGNSSDFKILVP